VAEPSKDLPPDARVAIEPATIEATFRNGSLTAISVVVGFSLTFLNRWAALPGPWHASDLVAVGAIVLGIACQIITVAELLSLASLNLQNYKRSVRLFLVGLGLVAVGVVCAIGGDIAGQGQRVLGAGASDRDGSALTRSPIPHALAALGLPCLTTRNIAQPARLPFGHSLLPA
jgi:hypothetical protein